MQNNEIIILECTLRDGSYAIDYQFSAEDTAIICAGLEVAGFDLIEIGHGLGLNASSIKHGLAAASDEAYLAAASGALKKAKFGFFCIPGIARLEDIDLAAKYKTGFIRVGTNVTEVDQAEPFIKRAKELGMMVFSNLMKSYAVPIDEFMKKVELSIKYGADVVAVVDSAGGMLPEDVRTYVSRIRNELGAQVDFHGHNNLHLAEANSLEAVKAGATIIDSSLQGMGRSAGNAQTELIVILLEKLGYHTGIDLYKTMDLGEKIVRPMMGGGRGVDPISATLGAAQFHSSFLKIVERIAGKYGVDVRELITKVSEIDRIKVTEELAEKVAKSLSKTGKSGQIIWNINYDFKDDLGKKGSLDQITRAVAAEMISLSKKTGKQTVFTIAKTAKKEAGEAAFPFIRQNAAYIIGNAEVATPEQAVSIAKTLDGQIDYIMVDSGAGSDLAEIVSKTVEKSKVIFYSDCDAQINAIDALISQFLKGLKDKKVLIYGKNILTEKLKCRLDGRGAQAKMASTLAEIDNAPDLFVGLSPQEPVAGHEIFNKLSGNTIIVDGGPGSLSDRFIEEANKKNAVIYRVDMRAGLSGEIINEIETYELKNSVLGETDIEGIRVIAGGILGKTGDIVIDSISSPSRVIGVADGRGQLVPSEELGPYKDKIKRVKLEIARMRYG